MNFSVQVLISVNRRPNIRGPRPYEAHARLAKRWGAMASAFEQTGGTRPATRRFAGPLANFAKFAKNGALRLGCAANRLETTGGILDGN